MEKASHLSRCVKGTLRNIRNVVGNFVTCTDAHNCGFLNPQVLKNFKISKILKNSSMETRLDLKVLEKHL